MAEWLLKAMMMPTQPVSHAGVFARLGLWREVILAQLCGDDASVDHKGGSRAKGCLW